MVSARAIWICASCGKASKSRIAPLSLLIGHVSLSIIKIAVIFDNNRRNNRAAMPQMFGRDRYPHLNRHREKTQNCSAKSKA
jgi:hypothetical protein